MLHSVLCDRANTMPAPHYARSETDASEATTMSFKYIETKPKQSKAQKRRDAKAAKKEEQEKRIQQATDLDEHQERRLEQEKFTSLLSSRNLRIHDIDADGDCLYKAIEHQLRIATDPMKILTSQQTRKAFYLHLHRCTRATVLF